MPEVNQIVVNAETEFERTFDDPAVPLNQALRQLTLPQFYARGWPVTESTILSLPIFRRCIEIVATTIAGCAIEVLKEQADGSMEADFEHVAYWLLAKEPSEFVTPYDWISSTVKDLQIHGNSYSLIPRNSFGEPLELIWLDAEHTEPKPGKELLYRTLTSNGQWIEIRPENILHFKGTLGTTRQGYSLCKQVAESFGVSLSLRKHTTNFFKNNAMPRCVIQMPTKFKDKEEAAKFVEIWNLQHGGDNAQGVAMLQAGATLATYSANNESAQLIQVSEREDRLIAALCGVPSFMLGLPQSQSYNSSESDLRAFLSHKLNGIMVSLEQEMMSKLLTEFHKRNDRHVIQFKRSDLAKLDVKAQAETDAVLLNNGIVTLNYLLSKNNLPSAGAEGDRRRMPSNIIFTDTIPTKEEKAAADKLALAQPPSPLPGEGPPGLAPAPPGQGQPSPEASAQLRSLAALDSSRLLTRLKKSILAKYQRADFQELLPAMLNEEQEFFIRSLEPLNQNENIEAFFANLLDELRATLKEQIPEVLERLEFTL